MAKALVKNNKIKNQTFIQTLKVHIPENILFEIAWLIVGGLSKPSKMPGYGWSISATLCKRGSKLRKIAGSVCHKCYACKGRYLFPNVKNALHNRLKNFINPLWVDSMITLMKDQTYFRWFDSGDLQSVDMLERIVMVCNKTPHCKHWLPTREFKIVKDYLSKGNKIPKNLCIRISADMMDEFPKHKIESLPFSTVSTTKDVFKGLKHPVVYNCPVSFNENLKSCEQAKCDSCWNCKVKHINYLNH